MNKQNKNNKSYSILLLLRSHQYVKNLFIFLPLFFGLKIFNLDLLYNAFITFILFSLTSSSIYTLNDLLDLESDKKHPKKKNRPIASGKVSKKEAVVIFFSILFIILALSLTVFKGIIIDENVYIIFLLYFGLNILYVTILKHFTLIDVFIVSIGFVLRLFAGSYVTNIELSVWIILMSFLLSLFMAFAKRRDDVVIYKRSGIETRKVIKGYSLGFLNIALITIGTITIVSYIMYTVSPDVQARVNNKYLFLTVLFVIFGVFRYLQLAMVFEKSGSPTKILLTDLPIQLTVVSWFIALFFILY